MRSFKPYAAGVTDRGEERWNKAEDGVQKDLGSKGRPWFYKCFRCLGFMIMILGNTR